MGGMTTLEYPLNTPSGYIRHIIPIATSARHSAWCISWGEAQRQSIYSDPAYDDGYYCFSDQEEEEDDDEEDDLEGKGTTTYKSSSTAYPGETEQERKRRIEERQPTRGLAAARMAALLTYRSRDSFESRFGRKYGGPAQRGRAAGAAGLSSSESGRRRRSGQEASGTVTPREDNLRAHNDGHRARKDSTGSSKAGTPTLEKTREVLEQLQVPLPTVVDQQQQHDGAGDTESLANQPGLTNLELSMPGGSRSRTPVVQENGSSRGIKLGTGATRQVFSAQSYLRYQGDKVRSGVIGHLLVSS
jgi:homoserine O-acetyltransferase